MIIIHCNLSLHYIIGINAGVMLPPSGWTVVRGDKCSIRYVDATDHSINCKGVD
jgi:hypothetical protein